MSKSKITPLTIEAILLRKSKKQLVNEVIEGREHTTRLRIEQRNTITEKNNDIVTINNRFESYAGKTKKAIAITREAHILETKQLRAEVNEEIDRAERLRSSLAGKNKILAGIHALTR